MLWRHWHTYLSFAMHKNRKKQCDELHVSFKFYLHTRMHVRDPVAARLFFVRIDVWYQLLKCYLKCYCPSQRMYNYKNRRKAVNFILSRLLTINRQTEILSIKTFFCDMPTLINRPLCMWYNNQLSYYTIFIHTMSFAVIKDTHTKNEQCKQGLPYSYR